MATMSSEIGRAVDRRSSVCGFDSTLTAGRNVTVTVEPVAGPLADDRKVIVPPVGSIVKSVFSVYVGGGVEADASRP